MARRKAIKAAIRDRQSRMAAVAERLGSWGPASEVLTKVSAQPTIFVQLDRATRCGGWPMQRFGIVHGPSSHGKTAFVLGLGLSFLQAGHFFAYVDAEFTTPEDWLVKLMAEHHGHPGFVAKRPKSYDDTVTGVRELVNAIAKARSDGDLDLNTSALIAVDSLNKLVPEKLSSKLLKGEGGFDGASGRAGMILAALHNQWLRELIPLLYHTNTAMVVIVREYDKPDAKPFEKQFKVAGGRGPLFDSSLAIRVTRAGYTKQSSGQVIGEKHKLAIYKTKVGGKEDREEIAYFYTSNGLHVPAGFDRARAVLEEAISQGVVQKKGTTYEWQSVGEVLGRGENAVVKSLYENQRTLIAIEEETRDSFGGREQ